MTETKKTVADEQRLNAREANADLIGSVGVLLQASQQWQAKGEIKKICMATKVVQIARSPKETIKFLGTPSINIAPPNSVLPNFLLKLKKEWEGTLSEKLKRNIVVKDNEFPVELTRTDGEKNLELFQKMKFPPIFLPGMTIDPKNSTFKKVFKDNWIMPPDKFYGWAKKGRISNESGEVVYKPFVIKRGIYLADNNKSVDYNDGVQVYKDDFLVKIIIEERKTEKIGKYDKTPMNSRFAITPSPSEWSLVCDRVKSELGLQKHNCQTMPYIYFVAIGNLYYPHYGEYNSWVWFADRFDGSGFLCGGSRDDGGIAHVGVHCSGRRRDYIAGRPLMSFAK